MYWNLKYYQKILDQFAGHNVIKLQLNEKIEQKIPLGLER